MVDAFVFTTSLISGISLTSFSVYYVVCLADIMFDFVAIDKGCKKMNRVVLLELMLIFYIPSSLFYSSHWIISSIVAPLTVHSFYRCLFKSDGLRIKYCPNSMKEKNVIKCHLQEAFIKILLHLLISLVLLYFCIVSVLDNYVN